ncbi:MAG: hypothetical protein D4R39_01110 [Methylophilaceae bacterium]|jgi:hypothetical protein|nr:MAG: hypothetical protein D4R39_01110 [Methylophilaceae bacterium]
MTSDVYFWWHFLCIASGLNILAWSLSAVALERRRDCLPADVYTLRRLQLILAAGYVFGCAYRSLLPVYDVPRICLFDSWMSSVIVGRSVATVAELCFVMQWALLLGEISRETGSHVGKAVSVVLVPLITIAETCCWYSVLTTSNLGHVIEESLWGISAASVVVSLIIVWPRCTAALRHLIAVMCITGLAYVTFLFVVDVPMYWARWMANEASGHPYLSLTQGIVDASGRWIVSDRWEDWKSEVVWMSLYFSVAVWLSISLIHAPSLKRFTVVERPKGMPIDLAGVR